MPSMSAHLVCAKEVLKIVEIDDKINFYKGAIYPDLIKDGHYKMPSKNKMFYVPNISKFLENSNIKNESFYLGYICHLLLDYYFLEEFAIKFGYEPFINGSIYKDYDKISQKLLIDFGFDFDEVRHLLSIKYNEVCIDKLHAHLHFLDLPLNDEPLDNFDYMEFTQFIKITSIKIKSELDKYKKLIKN